MALPCLGWVFPFQPNLDRPSQVWLETSLLGDSQSALAMMVPIKHVLGQAGENQIPPLCSVLFRELFPKPFSSYDSNEHCRMRQHAENPDLPLFFQSSSFLTVCLLTWRLFKLCLPQTRGQSVSVSMWPSEARQPASLVLCESPFVRESLLSLSVVTSACLRPGAVTRTVVPRPLNCLFVAWILRCLSVFSNGSRMALRDHHCHRPGWVHSFHEDTPLRKVASTPAEVA